MESTDSNERGAAELKALSFCMGGRGPGLMSTNSSPGFSCAGGQRTPARSTLSTRAHHVWSQPQLRTDFPSSTASLSSLSCIPSLPAGWAAALYSAQQDHGSTVTTAYQNDFRIPLTHSFHWFWNNEEQRTKFELEFISMKEKTNPCWRDSKSVGAECWPICASCAMHVPSATWKITTLCWASSYWRK